MKYLVGALSLLYSALACSFPSAPVIDRQVWFWEQVFKDYRSHQVLIHDADRPHLIVDVIDLPKRELSRKEERELVKGYLERYETGVKRFGDLGQRAYLMGAIEKRLLQVYKQRPEALKALMKGNVNLRSQKGLADKFKIAMKRSQTLLPHMERIFKKHGLPSDLTRIAFVESMFNTKAISKVGASGLWQFMPATGRRFLIINGHIDERNSPLKATRAAARLLRTNYKKLGNWPLAITAYNHGAAGMNRGARRLKTKRLSKMITHYSSPSFGFASKNFYAEFLAARKVYSSHMRKMKLRPKPLPVQMVKLRKKVPLDSLIRNTPLSTKMIRQYNPCIKPHAFRRSKRAYLPRNYELYVPRKLAMRVNRSLERL
ncbi:lytic transglycosylase domain-containing protein [Pseudobacteriovorax antillogorgiicola]|uniref:Transglycosylase SLT domain-containing protein n=1 Tax=Pseudobacteriovorax antillogorgiicola TaxID=1513793 RepID=A0A1Y6BAR0_9BACT|nr:lytic transglycosylase domain-containing protein [Pseudobacteriovorax antillogorgiicola]TCS57371.1 transglycosylase-like protein with SLT domain [Pseudobacteriovorax antillogorgiicola]SMF01912.1 Transglycosylase SLT domain-containing protein [Pseudobacteriovorax antillogorgiicola]